MKRIEYTAVTLKVKARMHRQSMPTESFEANEGLRLVRVLDGDDDRLTFEGPQAQGAWEIPWSNISAACRKGEAKK